MLPWHSTTVSSPNPALWNWPSTFEVKTNAPAGMRVESATTDSPGLTQSVDVGYRGRSIG
jgi:hypothetical protein